MSARSILLATICVALGTSAAIEQASAHGGGGGSHSIDAPSISRVLASVPARISRPGGPTGASTPSSGPTPAAMSGSRPTTRVNPTAQARIPRLTAPRVKSGTGALASSWIYPNDRIVKLNTPLPQVKGGANAGHQTSNVGSSTNPGTTATSKSGTQSTGTPNPATPTTGASKSGTQTTGTPDAGTQTTGTTKAQTAGTTKPRAPDHGDPRSKPDGRNAK